MLGLVVGASKVSFVSTLFFCSLDSTISILLLSYNIGWNDGIDPYGHEIVVPRGSSSYNAVFFGEASLWYLTHPGNLIDGGGTFKT